MTETEAWRERLGHMTVRQIRDFARQRHIPLAGASSKQGIITEIMAQWGHVWYENVK